MCKLLCNFFIKNRTFVISYTPITDRLSYSLLLNTWKR